MRIALFLFLGGAATLAALYFLLGWSGYQIPIITGFYVAGVLVGGSSDEMEMETALIISVLAGFLGYIVLTLFILSRISPMFLNTFSFWYIALAVVMMCVGNMVGFIYRDARRP